MKIYALPAALLALAVMTACGSNAPTGVPPPDPNKPAISATGTTVTPAPERTLATPGMITPGWAVPADAKGWYTVKVDANWPAGTPTTISLYRPDPRGGGGNVGMTWSGPLPADGLVTLALPDLPPSLVCGKDFTLEVLNTSPELTGKAVEGKDMLHKTGLEVKCP